MYECVILVFDPVMAGEKNSGASSRDVARMVDVTRAVCWKRNAYVVLGRWIGIATWWRGCLTAWFAATVRIVR